MNCISYWLGSSSKWRRHPVLPLAEDEGIRFPTPSPPPGNIQFLSFAKKEAVQTFGSGYLWGGRWGQRSEGEALLGYWGLSCKVPTFNRKSVLMHSLCS